MMFPFLLIKGQALMRKLSMDLSELKMAEARRRVAAARSSVVIQEEGNGDASAPAAEPAVNGH